jgi:hypothetical protein
MFRLWIIAAVLFVCAVGIVSYPGIEEEFRVANTDFDALVKELGGYSVVPTFRHVARGTSGVDYEIREGLCWYKIEDFRRLFPEYKDISDHVLEEKLYAQVGQPLQHPHPWRRVMATTGLAFGIPLAVLIFGYSLAWALAGFRSSPAENKEGSR